MERIRGNRSFRLDLRIDAPVHSLDENERESVDHVTRTLCSLSGSELSELTHSEAPWKNAHVGLEPFERSNKAIDIAPIQAFYSHPECSNPVLLNSDSGLRGYLNNTISILTDVKVFDGRVFFLIRFDDEQTISINGYLEDECD